MQASGHGRPFSAALFRLELRRGLAGGWVPLALLCALALAAAPWAPPSELLVDEGGERAARALARRGIWTGSLLFLVPALVLRSAGTFARVRGRDADWLGSRPTNRLAFVASTWLGASVASAIVLAAVALVVELRAGAGAEALAYAGGHSLERVTRIEPGEAHTQLIADPDTPAGSRLRARVSMTVGRDPTTDAIFAARRVGSDRRTEHRARVDGRTWIELELPAGPGDLEVTLANEGGGALVLLVPRSFELWSTGGSERGSSAALALRAALGLAAALALAIGLGAWMGPGVAAAGTLALGLAALGLGASAWIPGARLPRALEFVGEGRLPEPFDTRALVGLAGCVIVGFGLALPGLRSWRYGR